MNELPHERAMAPDHTESIPESECSTNFTPSMTSDATISTEKNISSAPWPGSTYIIRSISTGKVVTLRRGKVILAPLNGHSAIRWECTSKNGYIGFRDPGSYMYLGYDDDGDIRCSVTHHQEWEYFCVRQRPDHGHVLLMCHDGNMANKVWKGLCPVGFEMKEGSEKLTVLKDWNSDTIAWEFIKV